MRVDPSASCTAANEAGDGVRGQLEHTVEERVGGTCRTRQSSLPCWRKKGYIAVS